jgi:hypothetical protein
MTAAPHLLQNLTLPSEDPHCLQKAMKLRLLVSGQWSVIGGQSQTPVKIVPAEAVET